MSRMLKVKLYVLHYNREVPCYWELTKEEAILKHWNTHEILRIKTHFG